MGFLLLLALNSWLMDIANLAKNIHLLSTADQREVLKLLSTLEEAKFREQAQKHFLPFVRKMWPIFIAGAHHKLMAEKFEQIANGKLKRLIINMPPRHTKSEFGSWLLPAWFLGKYPHKKVIQTSNTAELAVNFGRKVRNLIDSPDYQAVFPGTTLQADVKAAGRWQTDKGGEYFAIGVDGTVTGKGADLFIIDDPHSEQEAKLAEFTPEIYDKVFEWYTSGPRQRLQPGAAIVVIMTRWSKRDLTGQLLKQMKTNVDEHGRPLGDEWEVIELPAIMDSGALLWPEFWSMEEMMATKAGLPIAKWNAQYMQRPTAEEGALIKRQWWKKWEKDDPPECLAVLQSWDTAFSKTQRADYSACTTWGVFKYADDEGTKRNGLILLDAFKDKLEFPELKQKAKELYKKHEPDSLIIEAKAAGQPLIFELRQMGIPVTEFAPSRGNDKITRVNAVTDLFSSGAIWVPEAVWANEVIEECASFPAGEHDDFVDSTTQALIRFRQGGWISISSDEDDEESSDLLTTEPYY